VTEAFWRSVGDAMRHVWPGLERLSAPAIEQNRPVIGILRQSAEVLPILISEPAPNRAAKGVGFQISRRST
jgi:hypothetical protein